jgi:excisionase family DNA binding protein
MSAPLRLADPSSRPSPSSESANSSVAATLHRISLLVEQQLQRSVKMEEALALLRFPMPLPLLKTSEVAKVLKVSEASVRRWIEAGQMKASHFDLGGKRVYRVTQPDLQAFIDGNPVRSAVFAKGPDEECIAKNSGRSDKVLRVPKGLV